MPSIQFQLEAPLARVEAHVRATYGSAARIVSVREVRTGGIGGFFAHRALDIIVDVPDAGGPEFGVAASLGAASMPAAAGSPSFSAPAPASSAPMSGLAGLLADADAGDGVGLSAAASAGASGAASGAGSGKLPPEFGMPPPTRRSMRAAEAASRAEPVGFAEPAPRAEAPTISTQSRRFAEVLDSVQAELGPAKPPVPETIRIAPALSRLAGDLVVIVGLGSDASAVADALADARGPYLRGIGGDLGGSGVRADDRRGAIGLRAAGVERGLPVLVSYGLGSGGPSLRMSVEALRGLAPDQVWVVVDVSRKPEDTVRWVSAVRAAVAVDAMAVVRGVFTTSDDTASGLGLPEGWSDAGR